MKLSHDLRYDEMCLHLIDEVIRGFVALGLPDRFSSALHMCDAGRFLMIPGYIPLSIGSTM
jgi:hypothetical protein